jgi:hypothetical protein
MSSVARGRCLVLTTIIITLLGNLVFAVLPAVGDSIPSVRGNENGAGCGGSRKSHATIILLAAGDSDVLPTIREQKHLLHHRSHCRYRHRPQIAPRVLAQG